MTIIKSIVTILVTFIGLSAGFCQGNGSGIEDHFRQYHKNELNEKLFVHTDKVFYLAGEILWFKLYYVDGSLHTPLDVSKIAYVEILDKNQKPVLQTKITLGKGSGKGSLFLPASFNSGVYTFRAYTQWMTNFNPDHYFEKPLTIVNAQKNPDLQPGQVNRYDIQFFPEGGNLVESVESKLAFRLVDRYGKGVDGEGVVVNQNNDTVARFHTEKFGLGNFMITPQAGNIYTASIRCKDTILTQMLPRFQHQGYVMKVSKESESKLRVSVRTNILSPGGVHLIVHSRQKIKFSGQVAFQNGSAEFIVDKNNLHAGISHFTVFNRDREPVCERLYFIRPVQKLTIESDIQRQYTRRSKVSMQVTSRNELDQSVPTDLSVSVYRADSIQSAETGNILNYFWLTSDLAGNIESPGYYLSENSPGADSAADNLMLTHGWRRFLWQNVLQGAKPGYDVIPEYKGHIITGKVINSNTGLPGVDVLVYLSVPGTRIQLYGSRSDTAGRIRFFTKDFYGPNEIIVQIAGHSDTTYRIEITNPFSGKFSTTKLPLFELPVSSVSSLADHSVDIQVQRSYTGDKLNRSDFTEIDTTAFFGRPDTLYRLDDYTRFTTMEEVLREYVMEVQVRRQKENFRLIMADGENKIWLDDPLTLFNGVPVFETSKIMQYDPLKLQRIEVLKRRFFYGPSILNGIVNFITYQPDPAMVSALNAVVFDYEGLQFTREFYSPVYETQEQVSSRLPDFRNVLYWSSDIKADSQGKTSINFYTSDRKGEYVVVLQGMNADGRFGAQYFSFTVK